MQKLRQDLYTFIRNLEDYVPEVKKPLLDTIRGANSSLTDLKEEEYEGILVILELENNEVLLNRVLAAWADSA